MNKMLIVLATLLIIGGCNAVPAGEEMVITAPEYLTEGTVTSPTAGDGQQAFLVNKAQLKLPDEILEVLNKAFPETDIVAITESQYIRPDTPAGKVLYLQPRQFLGEDGEVESDWSGVVSTIGAAFPPALPFVPLAGLLVSLFRKRSRRHLKDAFVAITPGLSGGGSQWGKSVRSVGKAVGWTHTEDTPEDVLETLIRVSKKAGKVLEIGKDGVPVLRELK